jgi:hypothetical protein
MRDALVRILTEHHGTYFNGVESRCKCGELVEGGRAWTEHVAAIIDQTTTNNPTTGEQPQ